jgi:hypothetical protein
MSVLRPQAIEREASVDDVRSRRRVRRRSLMVALVLAAFVAASAAAVALAATAARHGNPPAIAVGTGDIVKVAGAPIGCAVRRQDGEQALDCRRIGPLRGTYGAILTGRRMLVVRFVNKATATVVFSARHGSPRAHTCG